MPRKFKPLLIVAGFICLVILGSVPGHDKSPGAAAAASSGSAEITMLSGAGSDNSCQENDEEARIYVVITLRNDGDADGTVNPWATFDYSDGGNSTESYGSNHGGQDIEVPAHTEVDAYFNHTFNPQQHSMIRCAGFKDLGDGSLSGVYLPAS